MVAVNGTYVFPLFSAKYSGESRAILLPDLSVDLLVNGLAGCQHRLLKNGQAFVDKTG